MVFSDRALYQTYNFHDPEDLDRLAEWLGRDEDCDGSGVAVVAGRPGAGRDYVVRAAAWLAGERGVRVRHARLSFDGFDPDRAGSLAEFADHQLRMRFAPGGGDLPPSLYDRRGALLGLAGSLPATFLSAAGLSFLAAVALSFVDLPAVLRSGVPVLAGPRTAPEDHLRAILDFATRAERLVLVLPADELPETIVQWFVHEPRRNRRLSVVLGMASVPAAEALHGEPLAQRVELRQMTPEVLRERMDLRFEPNEFPDRFFSGLWKRTQGVPGQVALAMVDLDRLELVTRGKGGAWHLAVAVDDQRLVEYFASHFYDQLNQIRNQRGAMDLHLVRFVELAALCGSIVPPRLIAAYMGLTDAERDDLLDCLDELLDAGRAVFTSLDYRHPTFRIEQDAPELVYRFADESNRLIVLRRMIHRAKEARGLLEYLSSRAHVPTRGTAELFAQLVAYLPEDSREREVYTRPLRWWTTAEEVEALTEFLSDEVRAHRLDAQTLWDAVQYHPEWPPVRKLALLDAMLAASEGIPLDLLRLFYATRGNLLTDMGRFADALLDCRAGLKLVSADDYASLAWLHERASFCSLWASTKEDVLSHARENYRVTLLRSGPDSLDIGHAAGLVANGLIGVGNRDEAERYLMEAMVIASREISPTEGVHQRSVLMNILGVILQQLNRHDEAAECHQQSLRLDDESVGPLEHKSPARLMKLYALATSLDDAGRIGEARSPFEAAVNLATELSIPAHPGYWGALLRLLMIALKQQDDEKAEEWAELLCTLAGTESPDLASRVIANVRILYRSERVRNEPATLPASVRQLLWMLENFDEAEQDEPGHADS